MRGISYFFHHFINNDLRRLSTMGSQQNDEPNVYTRQNARYMYYLTSRNKSNERKVVYYNSFDRKHYLAKAHPFSSEADCKSVRVNYAFPVSIEELESVKRILNQVDMKTKKEVMHILNEYEEGGVSRRLVFRKGNYSFQLCRQRRQEILPDRDVIDVDREMDEDVAPMAGDDGFTPTEVVHKWEDEFGGFYVSPAENIAEYREGFQKHLQHFPKDDAPPSKKRKTGGARKRLDVEEHAALAGNNNDERCDDDELEMLMLAEIYLIMDELECKDIVDVILKHEHLLRERLNCNYTDLERLVRRRSADTLNDLHSIITSSLDGDGEK